MKKTSIPEIKIKINSTKLIHKSNVKYVYVTLDEHLTFEYHLNLLNSKLKRANNLIAISRHYLPRELLNQIYYGQFYSHLTYGCLLWGQDEEKIAKTFTLQKKAVRLLSFKDPQEHSSPIFKELKLLKLVDIIKLNNVLFTHATINKNTPPVFNDYFKFKDLSQNNVRNNLNVFQTLSGSLEIPPNECKLSLRYICPIVWNAIHRDLSSKFPDYYKNDPFWLRNISIEKLKSILKWCYLEYY